MLRAGGGGSRRRRLPSNVEAYHFFTFPPVDDTDDAAAPVEHADGVPAPVDDAEDPLANGPPSDVELDVASDVEMDMDDF